MGKATGFKEFHRHTPDLRPVAERLRDCLEIPLPFPEAKLCSQAARCMDCGVPFCHAGCPLGNVVPDWNDMVYRQDWRAALERLLATNNFPEFTGRLCPAPCEEACVLGINEEAVTIELIEKTIIERAFAEGWIAPRPPAQRTGKKVAIVGSGPAGLAAAEQLNRAGHQVTVHERADRFGGLLRYGIPDFKLEKHVIDRRLALMEEEGIVFVANCHVGRDVDAAELQAEFDAIVFCGGATKPRDMPIPGRELAGVYQAMAFLPQQNRRVAGDALEGGIDCSGKGVIVIGGGDTGSDCIGTANRQGARSVTSFEIMPEPPVGRPPAQPWPFWPMRLRRSTSHEEGCQRHWSLMTKELVGDAGCLRGLCTVEVGPPPDFKQVSGSEREWQADLVFLALGFLGPETDGAIAQLGLELDARQNVATDVNYMTSVEGVFAAGDMRRGQSLVVWAISEGREAARGVDAWLMGETDLPTKGGGDLPRV